MPRPRPFPRPHLCWGPRPGTPACYAGFHAIYWNSKWGIEEKEGRVGNAWQGAHRWCPVLSACHFWSLKGSLALHWLRLCSSLQPHPLVSFLSLLCSLLPSPQHILHLKAVLVGSPLGITLCIFANGFLFFFYFYLSFLCLLHTLTVGTAEWLAIHIWSVRYKLIYAWTIWQDWANSIKYTLIYSWTTQQDGTMWETFDRWRTI